MQILKTSKARENILAKIRKGLGSDKLPMPFPEAEKVNEALYMPPTQSAEEQFAEQFIALGGKFIFCDSEQSFMENIAVLAELKGWKQVLCADKRMKQLFEAKGMNWVLPANPPIESAAACITSCEALIGRTGSILVSSAQHMGRTAPVYYPVHIVFAYIDQVVWDIEDGMKLLKKKYRNQLPSMINMATGPSRTADIEKTLVVGVHGPAEVYCVLVNMESQDVKR